MELKELKEFRFKDQFEPKWISEKIDTNTVDYMEKFGFYLCDKEKLNERPGFNAMTSTQLRNIYTEVKRIQSIALKDFQKEEVNIKMILLRPKVAYATAKVLEKSYKNRIKDFRTVIELALKPAIKDEGSFKRFVQFFEGIIAYHKVYGGK